MAVYQCERCGNTWRVNPEGAKSGEGQLNLVPNETCPKCGSKLVKRIV